MKKPILLFLCLLCYTCVPAQHTEGLIKGAAARARMMQAFGGEENIMQARNFSYTLTRSAPAGPGSTTRYTLDLQNRFITTTTQTPSGTEVRSIDASGAWQRINGQRKPLSQAEQAALMRTFFFNFIPMLRNEGLQFAYLRSGTYQNRAVDIVRVSDPGNKKLELDLLIDQESGQVLTSGRDDGQGHYPYFADELEYTALAEGLIFPLVYRIVVDGRVTLEGKFGEVKIGQKKAEPQPRVKNRAVVLL